MDFKDLDLTELDKDLSEDQQKEWNAIYASYRSGSILTGRVAGMDTTTITLENKETGEPERVSINCLVIISYRVKVLIPAQQVWFDESTKRPDHEVGGHKKVISYFLRNGVASVTPFPVSAVLPRG